MIIIIAEMWAQREVKSRCRHLSLRWARSRARCRRSGMRLRNTETCTRRCVNSTSRKLFSATR